jgi:hypothetical protein
MKIKIFFLFLRTIDGASDCHQSEDATHHHLWNDNNDGYLLRLYNISSMDVFDNALLKIL